MVNMLEKNEAVEEKRSGWKNFSLLPIVSSLFIKNNNNHNHNKTNLFTTPYNNNNIKLLQHSLY